MTTKGIEYFYYNIPSNNRELQHKVSVCVCKTNYNIPSNNRELQHHHLNQLIEIYYNIPSNNRELQRVVIK